MIFLISLAVWRCNFLNGIALIGTVLMELWDTMLGEYYMIEIMSMYEYVYFNFSGKMVMIQATDNSDGSRKLLKLEMNILELSRIQLKLSLTLI